MQNNKNKIYLYAIGLLIVLNIVIYFYSNNKKDYLEVAFLDVGQGDSIFITAPNGKQMLVDGGKNESFLTSLSSEMNSADRTIDVVVATHPDADHIGGFPEIFDRFNILNYVSSVSFSETSLFKELENKSKKEGSLNLKAKRGDVIILDKKRGIYFQILSPYDGIDAKDTNNSSIVGRLVYGDVVFLLTGDASKMIENVLAYSDEEILESDVLKVGHHGSKTSSSLIFLEKVKPDFSIISAGRNNSYGHPHEDVISALNDVNSKILETSKEGNIVFQTNGIDLWRKQ